jgi:hypothetical protein
MNKKATDLRTAMQSRANPAAVVQKPPPATRAAETERPDNPHYRPGREGKSNVTGYFPPEVKRLLRMIAAERDTTIQDLLAEALNDFFAKNGKPEVAPRGGLS